MGKTTSLNAGIASIIGLLLYEIKIFTARGVSGNNEVIYNK
jgi:hypothetical protein